MYSALYSEYKPEYLFTSSVTYLYQYCPDYIHDNCYNAVYILIQCNHMVTRNAFTIHILAEHCHKEHDDIRRYLKEFVSKPSYVAWIYDVGSSFLARRSIPVSDYIESLSDPQVPLDQLGLLIFAHLQHTHFAVVLRNCIWTTREDNRYEDIELTLAYLGGIQFSDTCKGPAAGGFPAPSAFCLDALDEKKKDPASKPINMSKRKRCRQIRKPSTKPRTGGRRSSRQKARQRASKLVMLIDTSKPHPRETKNSKKPLFCVDLDSVLSTNRKCSANPKT